MTAPSLRIELPLFAFLALLWGSSYLFIKVAVVDIRPVTLIALRVFGAAIFLMIVMWARSEKLPHDGATWRMLLIQAIFNSMAACTILAWGQQHVEAGLASVLNSTSPVFVFLFTALITRHEALSGRKLVGVDALRGLGEQVAGQIACLIGAVLYAGAAIHGKRFSHMNAVTTAAGTMIWASVVLVPLALLLDQPWTLAPSPDAIAAAAILSILCTGVALLIYFRLVQTLGSMGVASQSYLRASIGVVLGLVFLRRASRCRWRWGCLRPLRVLPLSTGR